MLLICWEIVYRIQIFWVWIPVRSLARLTSANGAYVVPHILKILDPGLEVKRAMFIENEVSIVTQPLNTKIDDFL